MGCEFQEIKLVYKWHFTADTAYLVVSYTEPNSSKQPHAIASSCITKANHPLML